MSVKSLKSLIRKLEAAGGGDRLKSGLDGLDKLNYRVNYREAIEQLRDPDEIRQYFHALIRANMEARHIRIERLKRDSVPASQFGIVGAEAYFPELEENFTNKVKSASLDRLRSWLERYTDVEIHKAWQKGIPELYRGTSLKGYLSR